jgi:hypothetical protein
MLQRESISLVQEKIKNNKILVLIGTFENLNEKTIFSESLVEPVLFDFGVKKHLKKFKLEGLDSFLNQIEGKSSVIFKEAQLLPNLQEIIELILFEDISINLVCLCSFEPIIDDILSEVLQQQNLIIRNTSPSFSEIAKHFGIVQIEKKLEERLIFGNNEEVFDDEEKASVFLSDCASRIIKTTLNVKERINKTEKLRKLLQLIALSIGNHQSYNELATKAGLDNETVERYIKLLEKAQVLIQIPAFSTDQKYELKKTHCFYFYDNGIRNAFIKNFNALEYRDDHDALWKNWFVAEKQKKNLLQNTGKNFYFWVTHTKQKVDFIEELNGQLVAYQLSWRKNDKIKFPKSFILTYPDIKMVNVNRSTYWGILAKN